MILIQSINRDYSTDLVIKWLNHYGVSYLRINGEKIIKSIVFNRDDFFITLENEFSFRLSEIKAYWYRRGSIKLATGKVPKCKFAEFNKTYQDHLYKELNSILSLYLYHLKQNVRGIGDITTCTNVNKNIILSIAQKNGLNIPDTIITSSKKDVINFQNRYEEIISKPINNSFIFGDKSKWYPTYTTLVNNDILSKLPDSFPQTLFQQNISKIIEIRTFYLDGEFYSMAIFSQNDPKTKIDFRQYNDILPNRTVPFKLPAEIENKLTKLMRDLNFESGSIDLIYSKSKNYYFLEVNPIGQFGMVSHPCNYNLEKIIALNLINKSQYEL